MTEVLFAAGIYYCLACGNPLQFNPQPAHWYKNGYAIAHCDNGHDCGDETCHITRRNCSQYKITLRIPITRIAVEEDR